MTQESPLCYENTIDNESGYHQEDRESSINTLCNTTSSRDQMVHEDGRALALIKCLIWTCFVSLIVLALWILMYWRQPPDAVDWSTNEGIYQPRLCVCMISSTHYDVMYNGICQQYYQQCTHALIQCSISPDAQNSRAMYSYTH